MTLRSFFTGCCILVFAVCCTFMLISCRKKAPEIKNPAILGKWEGDTQTVEMFEDGKVILTDKIKKKRTNGSYEFIDDDTIRVKLRGLKAKEFKVSISQDKIIVTRTDGVFFAEYKRANEPKAKGEI